MESRKFKVIVSLLIIVAASCNEPESVVTNIVHRDGSVTRRIEMRSSENKFEYSRLQVPVDSSWSIHDSVEINEKGDTAWVRRAEKLFRDNGELAGIYLSDSSANREIKRHAFFSRKFRWFSTGYRFAEVIDKRLVRGYPVSDFLNRAELQWFYSPDNFKEEKKNSSDSLKYRAFNDTVDRKIEKWGYRCLISEWITEFTALTKGKAGLNLAEENLRRREDEFEGILEGNIDKADSLWTDGTLLRKFIGEADAVRFRPEADSAVNIALNKIWFDFREYTVRMVMPGKLTGTNGFLDSAGVAAWPVKSDFFLTQRYEMWAESKTMNIWAWILTGAFILFIISGYIYLKIRKG